MDKMDPFKRSERAHARAEATGLVAAVARARARIRAREAALVLAEDWFWESVARTGEAIVRAKQAADAEVLAECLAKARA